MRLAVGTSLAIIALKSLSGFYKYVDVLSEAGMAIDWHLVFVFGAIGIAGSFAGKKMGDYISQERLKKGFAVFLVAMSAFILLQNTTLIFGHPVESDTQARIQSEDTTMFAPLRRLFGGSADQLSAEEFKSRWTADDVVIDVRSPGEFALGHVDGAENIDFQSPDFDERVASLDRDGTYYLYCRTGNRSGMAARIMRELAFENAYNVGGLDSLERAGVKTTR
jgi:rhodanese-related sulfurtransferase